MADAKKIKIGSTWYNLKDETARNGLSAKAPLASPALTGTPTAPTASSGTNTTQIATTAFVQSAVSGKANTASPTFTGTPKAPTAASGTNTTQIATTAFVSSAVSGKLSDAPSDGKQYARQDGAWSEVVGGGSDILYFYNQAVNVATNAEIMRITNSAITEDTVVLECTFSRPMWLRGNVIWSSHNGYVSFTGTCFDATTSTVTLANKIN